MFRKIKAVKELVFGDCILRSEKKYISINVKVFWRFWSENFIYKRKYRVSKHRKKKV